DNNCQRDTTNCSKCGNGFRDQDMNEACDDDGVAPNDGCSSTCTVEPGWSCTGDFGQTSVCAPTCSNGIVDSGEACDPNPIGPNSTTNASATSGCFNSDSYPGQTPCKQDCSGYETDPNLCETSLFCGDSTDTTPAIITNPPETCDKNSRSCVTTVINGAGGYNGTQTCKQDCSDFQSCVSPESCGDNIKNGIEECDWNPVTTSGVTTNTGSARGGDGCATDCTPEVGFSCYDVALGPGEADKRKNNICVFHCGNGTPENDASKNISEQCDYGVVGIVTASTDPVTGRGLYNGDVCAPSYGLTCNWCNRSCETKTQTGESCGDGRRNGPETTGTGATVGNGCDDGDTESGDGCSSSCTVELGWNCSGLSCVTDCNDNICAGEETCVTCPTSCGFCPIGKRPRVATRNTNGATSLFEKIKTFLIQPTLLIQIPGLNLGKNKTNEQYIPPAPPTSGTYNESEPTFVQIGDEYYTITVQTFDQATGGVNFTIK
ncbi:MAG: hypothetical protein AAB276_00490, partial [Pseudomonadota bacterium]